MSSEGRGPGLSRREALKLAAGAALVAPLARLASPAAAAAADAPPRFFTADELALVDELTEMIIPKDAHSPGAREAKVAAHIDFMLAEGDPAFPEDAQNRKDWKEGLARTEALSRQIHGKGFLASTPEERLALLTRLAAGEKEQKEPDDKFFPILKGWTVGTYYTSKIGIHQELEYKCNTLLMEFVGELPKGPAVS
jgi:glucoside 3-dehydrogenase (cytochrome c) hitch-hiker subunit